MYIGGTRNFLIVFAQIPQVVLRGKWRGGRFESRKPSLVSLLVPSHVEWALCTRRRTTLSGDVGRSLPAAADSSRCLCVVTVVTAISRVVNPTRLAIGRYRVI